MIFLPVGPSVKSMSFFSQYSLNVYSLIGGSVTPLTWDTCGTGSCFDSPYQPIDDFMDLELYYDIESRVEIYGPSLIHYIARGNVASGVIYLPVAGLPVFVVRTLEFDSIT